MPTPTTPQPGAAELVANLRIDELRLFMQIAQLGSFSLAAQQTGISQSTASRRIKKLEANLGLLLFDRSSREVVLTDIGEQFLVHCQELLEQFDSTLSFVQSSQATPAGQLTICMQPWLAMVVGGEFFSMFRQQYPRLRLSLLFTTRERLLHNKGIDLFFGLLPPPEGQFKLHQLSPLVMNFFASKTYLASHPPIHHPKQLVQHECLCYRNPFYQSNEWCWPDDQGKWHRLFVTPGCDFEYIALGVDMAIHDGGVVWAPEKLVHKADVDEKLVPVFGDKYAITFHLTASHLHHNVVPTKIRVLIEALETYMND